MCMKPVIFPLKATVESPMFLYVPQGTMVKTDMVRYVKGQPVLIADVQEDAESEMLVRISAFDLSEGLPDYVIASTMNLFGGSLKITPEGKTELTSIVFYIENVDTPKKFPTGSAIYNITDFMS